MTPSVCEFRYGSPGTQDRASEYVPPSQPELFALRYDSLEACLALQIMSPRGGKTSNVHYSKKNVNWYLRLIGTASKSPSLNEMSDT